MALLKMTDAERIAYLEAQVSKFTEKEAAAKAKRKIGFKVSQKGAISMTGLRRFPITLYAAEWQEVLDRQAELKKCMADNKDSLSVK